MVRFGHGSRRRSTVSKAETMVCPLCASLNYHLNSECLTCGWRGAFGNEPAVIDYFWQRLTERYEEVRLEHIIATNGPEIGHFGVTRRTSPWQRVKASWATFCSALRARRPAKAAASRPNSAVPPV